MKELTDEKIEKLIELTLAFKEAKNPAVTGQAYTLGNWYYENCPDYICTTSTIIKNIAELTLEEVKRILEIQKLVKIDGIPTIKEEISKINKKIYEGIGITIQEQ